MAKYIQKRMKPILSIKIIGVATLTLLVGYICYSLNFTFDLSPIDTIYYILIVFPLGVILGQVERRRFLIIAALGELKAHVLSIALAYRDRDEKDDMDKKYQKKLEKFIKEFKDFLGSSHKSELTCKEVMDVERSLSEISILNEKMRTRIEASDISRVNQYVSKIIASFEIIKGYKFYGTSKLITNFLETVLVIGGFILIPHFVINGFSGIFVSPIITVTFLFLINIERILDNPLTSNDVIDTVNMNFSDILQKSIKEIFSQK